MSSAEPVSTELAASGRDILDTTDAGPRAIRGSILRSGGYVLGVLISLGSAPLLIRHLGVVDFGRYLTVVALITIVSGLTEGGLAQIAVRDYATLEGAARDRLMANILGLRVLLTLAGVAVAVGFAAAAGYGGALVLGTALAGIALFFQVIQLLAAVPLQAELRLGWVSATDLLRQVVQVGLIVALVVLGSGVVGFLAISIVSSVIGAVVTVRLVRGLIPLRPVFDVSTWRPMMRDTLPYAAAIALNVVYFRIAIVLMSVISTGLQTGYFATSFRIVEVLVGIPPLLFGAAFPILARAERDDRARFAFTTDRLFELSLVVGVWMAMCLEIGAGFAIDVIGGHAAHPAAGALRIQGLAIMGTFVAVACSFPLLALRRHSALLWANGAALVVSIALTSTLVPGSGAHGAAIAAVAAEGALALVTAVALRRAEPALRLPLVVIPLTALAGAVGWLVAWAVDVHAVVGIVVGSIAYVAVLAAVRRFPPEARDALRGSGLFAGRPR